MQHIRRPLRNTLLGLFVLGVIFVSGGRQTVAIAQPQSITLSPASTAPSLQPGASNTYNISVLNSGNTDYSVHVYASPYSVIGVNYDPSFTQLPGTTDPTAWIHISKTSLVVPAHETVVIPYTLTVPANTAPGGYYAVIFVETQPASSVGVQTHNRVGDILYITAAGKVRTGGALVNMPVPHFSMASSLPLSLEVSNSGGVHFLTTAHIVAKDIFGRPVFSAGFQRYVLPQTTRKIDATWQTPLFGFYMLSRTATVAGQLQSLPSQWLIIIHPWIAVGAAAIVVLVICFRLLRKRNNSPPKQKSRTHA